MKKQHACDNLFKLGYLNAFAKSIYYANAENPKIEFMDITSSEVQKFLLSLYKNKVEYLLIGGIATVFYGYVRTTQDLALWVKDTPENKKRLIATLKDVEVPAAENFLNVEMIPGWSTITIGDKGFVADLMGYTKAFKKEDFDECYKRARHGELDGIPITVIHLNDLIKEKGQLGRAKDQDDLENLKRINGER